MSTLSSKKVMPTEKITKPTKKESAEKSVKKQPIKKMSTKEQPIKEEEIPQKSIDEESDECVICYLELTNDNKISSECCKNFIHSDCLYKWVVGQDNTCPFCRHVFTQQFKSNLITNHKKNTISSTNDKQIFIPKTLMLLSDDLSNYVLGFMKIPLGHNIIKYIIISQSYTFNFQINDVSYRYFEMQHRDPQMANLKGNFMVMINDAMASKLKIMSTIISDLITDQIIEDIPRYQRSNMRLDLVKESRNGDSYVSIKENYTGQYNQLISNIGGEALPNGMGNFVFTIKIHLTPSGVYATPYLISAELRPTKKISLTPLGSKHCLL